MKKEIVTFGVGKLAKHFIPQLEDQFEITGLSRSFSCSADKNIPFNMGDTVDSSVNKNPTTIIVNFPPRAELVDTLKTIDTYFDKEVPLIFVSSTSIYGSGNATETTPLNKDSRLYPCENLIQNWKRPKTVLRPGGLFDNTRNPANFHGSATEISGPELPVNMVHSLDVAHFVKHTINQGLYGEAYNLVATTHPTKQEFYNKAKKLAGRAPVAWKTTEAEAKTVLNQKSKASGFSYKFDDLLLALEKINN